MTRPPCARPLASSGRYARSSVLSDDGRPAHDANPAGELAALGCPVFACTPDLFPDLMAAALGRDDIADGAPANDIALVRASA
jgi:hypothetical protein